MVIDQVYAQHAMLYGPEIDRTGPRVLIYDHLYHIISYHSII
jgi:hypothetical protein